MTDTKFARVKDPNAVKPYLFNWATYLDNDTVPPGDTIADVDFVIYDTSEGAVAGTDGTANVTTAARQSLTWTAVSGYGDFSLATQVDFTGGAANGPVFSITLWSAATTGTYYGEFLLTGGDTSFNAAGLYSLTAFDITGAGISEESGS